MVHLIGFPRLVVVLILVLGLLGLSPSLSSGQGTGGGAVITVTVLSSDGAAAPGSLVSAIDGDSPPTSQGPTSADTAGQVQLVNFMLGDQVTITAAPPPGVAVSGMTTTISVVTTPMSVTLTLGAPPTAPTPTPLPPMVATATPATAPPAPSGPATTLTVRTVDPAGASLAGAGYTISLPDMSTADALDGDDGASDGVTLFTGLPIGAAVTVTQTTPPGDTASSGSQSIVLTSFGGANVLTFTNQPLAVPTETPAGPLSDISVRALLCESADLTGNTEYTLGEDVVVPTNCPVAESVTFSFTSEEPAAAVAAAAVMTASTDATGVASVRLPAGAYTIGNELVGGTTPLTVDGVSVYQLTAVIYLSAGFVTPTPTPLGNELTPPARQTGDAQITVMVCTNPAQSGSVEFQVGPPAGNLDVTAMSAGVAAAIPDGCVPSAAELTILPFSDMSAATSAVSVSATGFVVVNDLASTAGREPHLLTAVATNGTYEAPFEIAPGTMTEIIARVFLGGTANAPAGTPDAEFPATAVAPPPTSGDGTGGPGGPGGSAPSAGSSPYVTNLPVTGTGASSAAPVAFLLLTMFAAMALAGYRRRADRP